MRRNINIQNYLPHREPMLMADEILEINHEKAVTRFEIKADNFFIENDLFSAAGLIENCAQTCSAICAQDLFEDKTTAPKVIGFISNIKKVKIHTLPEAGTEIISRATLISEYENICNIHCETYRGGTLLLEADIVMFIKKL